jgi:hypothetical protein
MPESTTTQTTGSSTSESLPEAIASLAKDALYVTVGFGVLAVQKANVQRQELAKRLGARPVLTLPGALDPSEVRARVRDGVAALDGRVKVVEQRVDAVLDEVQGRLPAQAADLLGQARQAGKAYQARVRELAGV